MILDIYKDSFEYAAKKIANLILLGVLSLFNFLIIPLIFFYGYNYRVVKQSVDSMINGEDVPPEFTNLSGMFVDGLKYIAVYLAYLIIPLIVLVIGINYNNFWVILIGILLFILAALIAFIAIPHMAANNDSLSSAFSFSELIEIISSIGYGRYILNYIGIILIYIVVVLVVVILLGIVLGFLGIATASISPSSAFTIGIVSQLIINCILFFLVTPYLSIFQSRCQGLIYNLRG